MLARLLGSLNKERALVYLVARERGYAREIAKFFGAPLFPIQDAMDRLEAAGVLVSRKIGTTRDYALNPRYPARDELKALLDRAVSLYPSDLRDTLLITRTDEVRRSAKAEGAHEKFKLFEARLNDKRRGKK